MCAWPKGVPRGPRGPYKKKDGSGELKEKAKSKFNLKEKTGKSKQTLEQALDGLDKSPDVQQLSVNSDELEDSNNSVCVIEEEPEWGLLTDRLNISVMKRGKYSEDTEVQRKINGQLVNVKYKKGEWEEWSNAGGSGKGPHYSTFAQAFLYIHRQIVKNKMNKDGSVTRNFAQIVYDSEQRILKSIKV